ncbi:hypothetical protein LJC34_01370 [Oscillospiraceae bacterium OttesenSCG-928-G22]|nr:hypothetical protein [Oscillospiraceae bacterium OttesenSCG-928-G22]
MLLNAGLTAVCAVFYLCVPSLLGSATTGQIVGLVLYILLFMPPSFFLLRGCALQNLFVIAYANCQCLFVWGIANWMEFRFGDVLLPGVNSVVAFFARLVLFPIFLPLGIRALKKLFAAWGYGEAQSFWKAVWLIPVALFPLALLSGTADTLTSANSLSFLLTRLFSPSRTGTTARQSLKRMGACLKLRCGSIWGVWICGNRMYAARIRCHDGERVPLWRRQHAVSRREKSGTPCLWPRSFHARHCCHSRSGKEYEKAHQNDLSWWAFWSY